MIRRAVDDVLVSVHILGGDATGESVDGKLRKAVAAAAAATGTRTDKGDGSKQLLLSVFAIVGIGRMRRMTVGRRLRLC